LSAVSITAPVQLAHKAAGSAYVVKSAC